MGAIRGVPVTQFLALKDPATGVRGLGVRSLGGVAGGADRPVGVRKNSPCLEIQGLFGGRFSMVTEGGGALRFRGVDVLKLG